EADARVGRTAEQLDQSVVPPAPGHRVLGAELRRRELEGRPHVIIQTSDQPRAHDVAHPHRLEILPCLPEVRRAVRAEELGERRSAVEHRSALSLLAIEHPQGIAPDPPGAARTGTWGPACTA